MFSKWWKISLMMGILAMAGHAAWAAKGNRITMLVVPARYSVMQVAFDIVKQYPVVLVSYQGDATSETPRLHAWNGRDWIPVSVQDYREASFLQIRPAPERKGAVWAAANCAFQSGMSPRRGKA